MAKPTKRNRKPTPKPAKRKLAEYFELEEKRLELQAQARDIARVQGETRDEVLAYVRAEGGRERCVIVHGYRLAIDLENERVEWKTELLAELSKRIGKTRALRLADRIAKDAGQKEVASIEPPVSLAAESRRTATDRPTKPPPGRLF